MTRRSFAIARAAAVIGGMGALIIGATFAATDVGTVALTANSFATTSTGLQISNDGTTFSDSATGFAFGSLAIGGTSTKENFWLEDTSGGTSQLAVTVAAANVGTLTGLDPTKVMVNIEMNGGSTVDSASLSDLESGTLALSAANEPTIETDATTPVPTEYNVWLSLSAGAITGTVDATTDTFGLNFTGTSGS
jgi:hypothetical protein